MTPAVKLEAPQTGAAIRAKRRQVSIREAMTADLIDTIAAVLELKLGLPWQEVEPAARAVADAIRAELGEALSVDNAPVGTIARAIGGGHWCRTKHGWKWNGPDGSGGTFPRPGADWRGQLQSTPPAAVPVAWQTTFKSGGTIFSLLPPEEETAIELLAGGGTVTPLYTNPPASVPVEALRGFIARIKDAINSVKVSAITHQSGGVTRGDPSLIARCDYALQLLDEWPAQEKK